MSTFTTDPIYEKDLSGKLCYFDVIGLTEYDNSVNDTGYTFSGLTLYLDYYIIFSPYFDTTGHIYSNVILNNDVYTYTGLTDEIHYFQITDFNLGGGTYIDPRFEVDTQEQLITGFTKSIISCVNKLDGLTGTCCPTQSVLSNLPWVVITNEGGGSDNCDDYIARRTPEGWTLDFVFNKNGDTGWTESVFFFTGVRDEYEIENYADNGLSFRFTTGGTIQWTAYRFSGYCDTISGYTEMYYLETGKTFNALCSGGTSNDFNITITFERFNVYDGECELPNEGGWNDLIIWTGTTEELNKKWTNERNKRLGTLKIYHNSRPIYKLKGFEEIVLSDRGYQPFTHVVGGGVTGSNGVHEGICCYDIKYASYFEDVMDFIYLRNRYLTETFFNYNISECEDACEDAIRMVTPTRTPSVTRTASITPTATRTPSATPSPASIPTVLGLLYNACAIDDPRNMVAPGWRVPLESDFILLNAYLVSVSQNGGSLKDTGTIYSHPPGYWIVPNAGATNITKFKATGSGRRTESGIFENIYRNTYFWTSTSDGLGNNIRASLSAGSSTFFPSVPSPRNQGLSIRLIKESTTLTHGELGTYVGNNGITYRTVCIGTQEWLSSDLAETRYQTGEYIIEIRDNATWSGGTVCGYCAYDNNWSYVPGIAPTPTPSQTPSVTITSTITPTRTVTPSITPSITTSVSPSETPSITPSITITPSVTPSTSMGIYYGCLDYQLELSSCIGGTFLSAGDLISANSGGTIGDYVIEWRLESTEGDIAFVSGIGSDVDIQAQHPFIDEVVFAGTLYPIIRYVYIDSNRYNVYSSAGMRYSPDLLTCLSPVLIDPLTCSTERGTDPLYPFHLAYNNVTDYGQNKSREFQFVLSPDTMYFAWEFQAYTVAEQLKIYYCTTGDTIGTLVDNFIHGINGVVVNLYPTNYPTNPKIANPNYPGMYSLAYVTVLTGFTWSEGNYLRIQIIGSVYEPTVTNTNWYIKCKCLTIEDINCDVFIADTGMNKIIPGSAHMVYSGDPTCLYNMVYETEDSPFVSLPSRTTGGLPNIYKYVGGYTYWWPLGSNPSGNRYDNPTQLGMRWSVIAQTYGVYASAGYDTCVNLNSGQTISVTKTTTDITFTFSDIDDYNKYVSDILAFKATSYYNTWTGLTSTDPRYYATMRILTSVATSCGDTKINYYWYFFWGCPISYDAGLKTITITFVIPTNDIVSGSCDSTYTIANSVISTLNYIKNYTIPGGALVTNIRTQGTIYTWWENNSIISDTQREFIFGIMIEDGLLNNICDISAFGFCKGVTGYSQNLWVLPKWWDRVTLTNPTNHENRLNYWRLERRKFLRTDNCADMEWETVAEITGPTPTPTPSITPTITTSITITPSLSLSPTPTPSLLPISDELLLTFDSIANASGMIGGDATSLDDWNSAFGFPTNPFTSINIVGNEINLKGGSNIKVPDGLFSSEWDGDGHLISIVDALGCIVETGYDSFGDAEADMDNIILTTAILPALLTGGTYSFYGCKQLIDENIDFSSLQIAMDNCFRSCHGLINPIFPSLTTASEDCFYDCRYMNSPNFSGLTTAGEYCFQSCSTLTTPNFLSLTTADNYCFISLQFLNTDFPSLITAGGECFYNCIGLIDPDFSSLETAGNLCFYSCTALTSISLLALTTAGNLCFYSCTALTSISLPLLTTAGYFCFAGCTALTTISLPALAAANTSLGGTSGDDNVFHNIIGKTITLTVPVYFQTNDGGNPDGDIVSLAANNNETIIYV